MRRPSVAIQDLVSNIDALSGKYFTKWQNSEENDGLTAILKEVLFANAEIFLTGCAQTLEYCIGRPLYHTENLVLGKSENKPVFIYSR